MFREIQIPDNIDEYVLYGIKKATRLKRRATVRKWSGLAVFVLLTIFVGAVRVSPVFASYAAKIPGLEYIVDLISYDKGLQAAVDNEFVQHVGASSEAEGIVFTVKDIIVDNTSMVMFCSIENKGGWKWPQVRDVKLQDEQGRNLEVSYSSGFTPTEKLLYEEKIVFYFHEDREGKRVELPDRIYIAAKMAVSKEHGSEDGKPVQADVRTVGDTMSGPASERVLNSLWKVAVSIDKSKFKDMEETYDLHNTVTVEGQKITFEKLIVYPTRVCIDITFDPANTKKIFAFEDLALTDEKGEQWKSISNGVTASLTGEDSIRLYFQSNYFSSPSELYLAGSRMRALDKDKLEVIVDPVNEKLLKAPDDRIALKDVWNGEGTLVLRVDFTNEQMDRSMGYSLLHYEAKDAGGKKLDLFESGMGTANEHGIDEQFYKYKYSGKLDGPLYFLISDYPERIQEAFKVRIPIK
jgi:Family of unknown function (DUF5643)/Domain of unknown function (DUF4179)